MTRHQKGGRTRARAADLRFREYMANLGFSVIGTYTDTNSPIACICPVGHECTPRPANALYGFYPCSTCARIKGGVKRRRHAEDRFRARVAELGYTVVGEYVNFKTPVGGVCPAGHECRLWPSAVQAGRRPCLICAGNDKGEAESRFRQCMADLGCTVLGDYVNAHVPVAAICAEGHPCSPRPSSIRRLLGPCDTCGADAGPKTRAAGNEPRYRQAMAALGYVVVGDYKGVNTPVEVICPEGHEVRVRPGHAMRRDVVICRVCAGQDWAGCNRRFRDRMQALGCTVIGTYVNSQTPVLATCKKGHLCDPRPCTIQQGVGPCRTCAGMSWDAFYVVVAEEAARVKFGITSGDPRPRLTKHRGGGYRGVVRLIVDLPGTAARDLERMVRAALRDADVQPVRGREYFDVSALGLILDIVDGHTSPESADTTLALTERDS